MSDVVDRVLHDPRVEPHVSACLRGRLVKESARFAIREMRNTEGTHVYRIRASGLLAAIEHGTPDVLTLDQAFYQRVYEPPEGVCSRLRELARPLRALDLGANIGLWGLWLHGRFTVGHMTALEPDPENAAKHRRQIALNGLSGSWELVEAAATCSDGSIPFTAGHATTGRIGEESEPGTVTVVGLDVFSLLGDVDLLKVDIEGAEWPILADPRLGGVDVPVVMIEYHPYGAPSSVPADDVRSALSEAGYDATWSMHGAPDGTGVVWGTRS
jgi:FkbM family methyltransferase